MKIIKVKLIDLKLTEDNVRMHPTRQIEEYKRSLEMFGQTKNAVIDEDNNVLIGNGLVIAAREMGWDEISVIKRTDLSQNEKLKLMVSDNKIFGLGVDNLDAIDRIFDVLKGDLDIPGYDEDTLNSMVASADAITDELAKYGTMSESDIENMKNRAPAPVGTTEPLLEKETREEGNNEHTDTDENENADDDKISFKCPDCGVESWLSKDVLRQLLA